MSVSLKNPGISKDIVTIQPSTINRDLVGCAHTPIAAAHRSRSLGAIDPSPQSPFAAFLLSSYLM